MPIKKNSKQKRLNKQKGGVAPSCVNGVDVSRYTCHSKANIHNNPQGNRDLDAVFKRASKMQSGGNVSKHPSGCGCSSQATDFKGYLKEVSSQLGQSGGGYSMDIKNMIAGQPEIRKYDDCCPPALIGGKLKFGLPGKSTCGGNMGGGARKKQRSKKMNKSNKSSKSHKSKNMSRTNKSKKMNRTRKQKGGHYSKSKPAQYPKAHETAKSHFGEVTEKDFSQRQPFFNEMSI